MTFFLRKYISYVAAPAAACRFAFELVLADDVLDKSYTDDTMSESERSRYKMLLAGWVVYCPLVFGATVPLCMADVAYHTALSYHRSSPDPFVDGAMVNTKRIMESYAFLLGKSLS